MYGNSNLDISVETLINSIGSAVLVFDKSLTVRYFNKEAEKIIPQLRKNLAAEAIFNNKKIIYLKNDVQSLAMMSFATLELISICSSCLLA